VRPGAARARWRQGPERSVPLVAAVPDAIPVPLDDVSHTFRKACRIVVHVQSSWFPAVDRNP
jgi:predicted acyl esterase